MTNPYGAPPPSAFPGPSGWGPYPPAPWPVPDYAGWGARVGAYVIDLLPSIVAQIVFSIGYVLFLVGAVEQPSSDPFTAALGTPLVFFVAGLVLGLAALGWQIYNRWMVGGRTGQSMGKRALGIRLVSEQTGQPIGPLNAFTRDLVHIVDGVAYVGFLWPLWDDKKQTFADMLVKTIVVKAPRA